MELPELLDACLRGDELAWEALVRRYQGRILGLTTGYVGNGEDARDLAQEIFVKIYRHLSSCRGAESFEAWMLQVGRSTCLDHLRRRKVRPPAQDLPAEELRDLADSAASGEERARMNARRRLVQRALSHLDVTHREILVLRDIEGLGFEEIAAVLQVPVGTAKSRSHRARLALAEKIVEWTHPDGSAKGAA